MKSTVVLIICCLILTSIMAGQTAPATQNKLPVDVLPPAIIGYEYLQPLPVDAAEHTEWKFIIHPDNKWFQISGSNIVGTPREPGSDQFTVTIVGAPGGPTTGWFQIDVQPSPCSDASHGPWCFPFTVPELSTKTFAKYKSAKTMMQGMAQQSDGSIILDPTPDYVVAFDRAKDKLRIGKTWMTSADAQESYHGQTPFDLLVVAILNSKVVTTGTVITYPRVQACARFDWKIIMQSEATFNPILYNSTDVSPFCVEDGLHPDATADLVIVAPEVETDFVELFGYLANRGDSMRKPPTPLVPKNSTDCDGVANATNPPDSLIPRQEIRQCDDPNNPHGPKHPANSFERDVLWTFYRTEWIYDRLTAPGIAQGTVSFTPVIGQGTQSFINDIQIDPATQTGPFWLSLPVVFEKGATAKSDLDSLTASLTLGFRPGTERNYADFFHWKRAEMFVGAGPEVAVTRHILSPMDPVGTTRARDLNFVETGTFRTPFAFNFAKQPSVLTVFPTVQVQGGVHLITHRPENDPIYRTLIGADASFRWPWAFFHNVAGEKPATIDFSYRTSFLGFAEPFTDISSSASERQSTQRRSYTRITYNVPFSTYFGFKVTLQKGSLPPDFHSLGYALSLGVTLLNPGIAEH